MLPLPLTLADGRFDAFVRAHRDRAVRVAAALDALPAGQREAFVLVHLEGLTVVETAALVGSAPGTIKSHLHRALVALRVSLADLAPGAP